MSDDRTEEEIVEDTEDEEERPRRRQEPRLSGAPTPPLAEEPLRSAADDLALDESLVDAIDRFSGLDSAKVCYLNAGQVRALRNELVRMVSEARDANLDARHEARQAKKARKKWAQATGQKADAFDVEDGEEHEELEKLRAENAELERTVQELRADREARAQSERESDRGYQEQLRRSRDKAEKEVTEASHLWRDLRDDLARTQAKLGRANDTIAKLRYRLGRKPLVDRSRIERRVIRDEEMPSETVMLDRICEHYGLSRFDLRSGAGRDATDVQRRAHLVAHYVLHVHARRTLTVVAGLLSHDRKGSITTAWRRARAVEDDPLLLAEAREFMR